MAALTVYLSASPADAAFAARLREAIIANGGKVVSSPTVGEPSATPSGTVSGASGASPDETTVSTSAAALPARQLKTLDDARAYVAVLSPDAAASARLRSEAQAYAAEAQRAGQGNSRGNKRKIVPVQLTPPTPESTIPALQAFNPVTGPYNSEGLQDDLIAETLKRLGLPPERSRFLPLLLIAALLALLLLACAGLEVFAPAGQLHFLVSVPAPTATPTASPTVQPTATATRTPAPAPGGLLGQYYRSHTIECCMSISGDVFDQLLFTQVDPQVNVNGGYGRFPDPRLAGGAYAIRWTGQIVPKYSETYTLITHSDDGVRVWINGQLVIDDWSTHDETADKATLVWTANQHYDIRIDYYENDESGATMTLQWQSASQPLELVPASQLYAAPK